MTLAVRRCAACGKALPERAYANRRTCSPACRKQASRKALLVTPCAQAKAEAPPRVTATATRVLARQSATTGHSCCGREGVAWQFTSCLCPECHY
jgi:hypothetical protein